MRATAHPLWDAVFRLSHWAGGYPASVTLVVVMAVWHASGRRWRAVGVWVSLGLTVLALERGLKFAIDRPRPELWRVGVIPHSPAMPSGHALASAAFGPLLASEVAAWRPAWRAWCVAAGVAFPLWVGVGRLYLGVHWPSDVLAGWGIGLVLTAVAIRARHPGGVAPSV